MTVGCNWKFTPKKWDRMRYLLNSHSRMVKGIASRESWSLPYYCYFDMYSGPGIYGNGENRGMLFGHEGSPLIAAGILRDRMPHRLYFNDSDLQCVDSLRDALTDAKLSAPITHLDAADFARLIADEAWRKSQFGTLRQKAMGLCVVDPNGLPDWDAIYEITDCPQYRNLDVLININSAVIKFCRANPFWGSRYKRLDEYLAALDKRYLYVWQSHKGDPMRFSLMFATNWDGFPSFAKSGFWRCDQPEGREILRRLSYTQEEMAV